MKRKSMVLLISAFILLSCAWLGKPNHFQFTNSIAYAKNIDADELYNTSTRF